jgi:MFS-type transporter involved in bile tolerance (Atg22 family)
MLTVLALALPGIANAQYIPPIIVALALSPLLVMLFAVILGVVSRSWLIGARHVGLIVVWIVLFGIAAYWVENDYVIWTPLALYVGHAIVMIILIVKRMLGRSRAGNN